MAGNKDRQRRQAREKYQRQQEQRYIRQRQIRKRSLITVGAIAGVGLIVGLTLSFTGGSPKPKPVAKASPTASATPSASTVAEPAHHCTYTATPPAARAVSLPPTTPDFAGTYTASIKTNVGTINVNLLNSKATCTVNSFVHLAQAGYFNNTQCHRMLTSGIFVLQCGDPTATASANLNCSTTSKVGSGTPGYAYASENLTGAKYTAGTIAMANSGSPTSNGSQFFIVYKDSTTGLGPNYTPFATLSSGLDIVQNVANHGYSCQYPGPPSGPGGGVPKEKVIINSVTIKKV